MPESSHSPLPSSSAGPHSARRVKIVFFVSFSILFAFVFSLAVMECVLRVLWGSPVMPFPPDAIRSDPDMGTVLVPNFQGISNTGFARTRFSMNSQGFRDEERTFQKSPGVFRVLAVGDSFVQGYGVEQEEIFLSVCERELAALGSDPPVEIVKAGVGGWDPWDEWKFVETRAEHYSPDMILMVFYLGNDFVEFPTQSMHGVWNGVRLRSRDIEQMTRLRAFRVFLRKHVYVYGFLESFAKNMTVGNEFVRQEDKAFLLRCAPDSPPFSGACTRLAFENIRDWCEERGILLYVLLLPHRTPLERNRVARLAREFRIDTENLDYLRPSTLASRFFEEIGLSVLDPTPALYEWTTNGRGISFPTDVHYTPETHFFLGREYLAPQLMEIAGEAAQF